MGNVVDRPEDGEIEHVSVEACNEKTADYDDSDTTSNESSTSDRSNLDDENPHTHSDSTNIRPSEDTTDHTNSETDRPINTQSENTIDHLNPETDSPINTHLENTTDNPKYQESHLMSSEDTSQDTTVYVNKSLFLLEDVKDVSVTAKMSTVYNVNGSTYVEDGSCSHDDTPVQYELYKVEKGHNDTDDEDMTTALEMHIQTLPLGRIINSTVFLKEAHWHTVCLIQEELCCCAVCRIFCHISDYDGHIRSVKHLRNLDNYKPLSRFDLSIIRKIYNNLHCGVCNEIFDVIDYTTHESTKSHEENLLTAINKVSDLMYDSNIHRNYDINLHTDKNVPSDRNMPTEEIDSPMPTNRNMPDDCMLTNRNMSDESMKTNRNMRMDSDSHTNQILTQQRTEIMHFNRNEILNRNASNRGYPRLDRNVSEDRDFPSLDRNFSSLDRDFPALDRNSDSGYGLFGFDPINNNNINVTEEFSDEEEYTYEGEEYNTPFQGVSYASMASKPRQEVPKYLKIDLGTKEVRVLYESWHMIVKTDTNQFYCMVCNQREHIRYKTRHCVTCEHVDKLARCSVVSAFEDYLIRMVGDKLYHCGHCNNLQYQNQMMEHIETTHPKKNKNLVDETSTKTKKPTKIPEKTTKNDSKKTDHEKVTSKTEQPETKAAPVDIFGEVNLSPFGCQLSISALSYNIIININGDYYCAICDEICADVKSHVEDGNHKDMMQMAPFIRPFKSHLTRAVRGTLHCGICNILIQAGQIIEHNMEPKHTTALASAMGLKKSQKLETTHKNTNLNNSPNTNTSSTVNNISNKTSYTASNDTLKNSLNSSSEVNKINSESNKSNANKENFDVNKCELNKTPEAPKSAGNHNISVLSALRHANNDQSNKVLKISESNASRTPLLSPNHVQDDVNNIKNMDGAKTGISVPSGQNMGNIQNIQFNGQNARMSRPNLPWANTAFGGQNMTMPGQNMPFRGQNMPIFRQRIPLPGQNVPYPGQNLPHPSQNARFPGQNTQLPAQNMQYGAQNTTLPYAMQYPNAPQNINHNQPMYTFNVPIPYGFPNQQNTTKNNTANNKSAKDALKTDTSKSFNIKIVKEKLEKKALSNEKADVAIDLDLSNTDTEISEIDKEFDEDECVFLKLKTTYFKISNLSFNTLIYLDYGVRYCFVCSVNVPMAMLQKHIESREHTENIAKNRFLDKYGMQLFRQMYLMYHCAICNVLMTRKEIKMHLDWPIHIEEYDIAHKVLNKKNKKKLLSISGIKEYVAETQKEALFHNANEPKITIVSCYQIVSNVDEKDTPEMNPTPCASPTVTKKNKMVILNNVVMKVQFDHWHGITSGKKVTKCILCQVELNPDEILEHVAGEYHKVALGKTFEKAYYPTLIRKINEMSVNCVICNLEVPSTDSLVVEHINGRKHIKHQERIVNETSHSDSYADCYEDYLHL